MVQLLYEKSSHNFEHRSTLAIYVGEYLHTCVFTFKCGQDVCSIADRHSPDTYMYLRTVDRDFLVYFYSRRSLLYILHARRGDEMVLDRPRGDRGSDVPYHGNRRFSISATLVAKRPFGELCNEADNEYRASSGIVRVPCSFARARFYPYNALASSVRRETVRNIDANKNLILWEVWLLTRYTRNCIYFHASVTVRHL